MLFFLTCLYISVYYIRPTEWVPGILGLPLLFYLAIVCLVSILANVLAENVKLLRGNTEVMMLGFIAAIIFSHASHGYVHGVVNAIDSTLSTIVGFFLVISAVKDRASCDRFIVLVILLTLFLAFQGWRQHATGYAIGGMDPVFQNMIDESGEMSSIARIRWYGVFNDPNDLGLALVLVIPFLLTMIFNGSYLVPILCSPLLVSALYYTKSRGSLLAALASILAYFVIRYRSVSGAVFGLMLAGVLFAYGPSKLSDMSGMDESAYGRIEAWYNGFQMFKASSLFGVGHGMFTEHAYTTAHNSFVLVMAELGIFGLFFYTGMIYFPLNWLWRNVFVSRNVAIPAADLGLLSAVFSSLIGMLVAMFFLSRSYILVPFMLIALATSATRICSTDANVIAAPDMPVTKGHLKHIAIITMLQIVFINIMVKIFI